jgi:hypothetical protein
MDIVKKLPKDVPLSPHLQQSAMGFIVIQLYGLKYYIPLTKEFKKLFKIKRRKNKFIFSSYKSERQIEEFLRDVIASIYLQIRDTVGSEIHLQLNEEIKSGFTNLFANILEKKITDEFQKKLPLIK